MNILQPYIADLSNTESLLITSISLFVFFSLVFLLALFTSRYLSNQQMRAEKRFQPLVEELLFLIMFNGVPIKEVLKNRIYTRYHKKRVYLKMLTRSCFEMHQHYTGDIAERLEAFYQSSALKSYSLQKLKSSEWYKKCQAIRELSEMNQTDASAEINKLCFSENQLVRQNAFMAIIHLQGIEGLKDLHNFTQAIDDWTLAHILISIEKTDTSVFPNIDFLLQHKNPSLVVLGLRLIQHFNVSGYHEDIQMIKESPSSERIELEVQKHFSTEFQPIT